MLLLPKTDNLLSAIRKIDYDDWVDRLNYYVTSIILVLFTMAVASKQVWGEPIRCWTPAQFKSPWEDYTHEYCFVQSTYRVPERETLRLTPDFDVAEVKTSENLINFYQWAPVILAMMSFGFTLPNLIWKLLAKYSGIRLKKLVSMATDIDIVDCKPEAISDLAKYFENSLGTHVWMLDHKSEMQMRGNDRWACATPGGRTGIFATCSYIFIKILYTTNAFVQCHLISTWIGQGTSWFGMHAISELWTITPWDVNQSTFFPRVTMCDVEMYAIGDSKVFTVQCVLMLNMYLEKIFVFMWFWCLAVGIVSAISTAYWMFTSLPAIISRHLTLAQMLLPLETDKKKTEEKQNDENDELSLNNTGGKRNKMIINTAYTDVVVTQRSVRIFANELLRADGILAMRFVAAHAGKMAVSRLLMEMYKRHRLAVMATSARNQIVEFGGRGMIPASSSKCVMHKIYSHDSMEMSSSDASDMRHRGKGCYDVYGREHELPGGVL